MELRKESSAGFLSLRDGKRANYEHKVVAWGCENKAKKA